MKRRGRIAAVADSEVGLRTVARPLGRLGRRLSVSEADRAFGAGIAAVEDVQITAGLEIVMTPLLFIGRAARGRKLELGAFFTIFANIFRHGLSISFPWRAELIASQNCSVAASAKDAARRESCTLCNTPEMIGLADEKERDECHDESGAAGAACG